jgi:hypothetical protein
MSEDEMPIGAPNKSTPLLIKVEAEKDVALDTASYFAERKERADLHAFKRILTRRGGVAGRQGDER